MAHKNQKKLQRQRVFYSFKDSLRGLKGDAPGPEDKKQKLEKEARWIKLGTDALVSGQF
jgi:hypothetical protein